MQKGPSLSFRDVRTVLALADGQAIGTVRFEQGDLAVTVECGPQGEPARAVPAARGVVPVPSPAVGTFHRSPGSRGDAPAPGAEVGEATLLGLVRTDGRETPVAAGVAGSLVAFSVEDGDFVEYGQSLAEILPSDT